MKEKIILDTQIIIWLENDFDKISNSTLEIILSSDLVISKVSIWEIAIKTKLGKLTIQKDLNSFIEDFTKEYSVHILDIKLPSIYHTQKMPFHHKDPFDRLIVFMEVFQILANSTEYELLNTIDFKYNFQKKDELRLKKVLNFIEKNFQNNIEFKTMADLANMTVPAFSAYFKKTMSVTFTDFLNEYRINQACNLLLQGKSVNETSFDCGFNSVTYFVKAFKKLKGYSPLAFQKKMAS